MVARSRPVGINPRPKPKTDEDRLRELREADVERLRRLLDGMARNIMALNKAVEEVIEIAERKIAA